MCCTDTCLTPIHIKYNKMRHGKTKNNKDDKKTLCGVDLAALGSGPDLQGLARVGCYGVSLWEAVSVQVPGLPTGAGMPSPSAPMPLCRLPLHQLFVTASSLLSLSTACPLSMTCVTLSVFNTQLPLESYHAPWCLPPLPPILLWPPAVLTFSLLWGQWLQRHLL